MQQPFLYQLLQIARMSSGRRVSLYNHWLPLLVQYSMLAVITYVERAIAHDNRTKELENRWANKTTRRYSIDMPGIDTRADQLMFGLISMIHAQVSGLAATHPLVITAAQLESELFPAGVYAIASQPYVEQAVAMEVIVQKLQGAHAAQVSELGLEGLVLRFAEVVAEYRQSVDDSNGRVLYTQVKDNNHRGHMYLAEILCMIVAQFHDSSNPDHVAARAEFLKLLMDHDRQSRADRRARRARGGSTEDELDDAPDDVPGEDGELDDMPGEDDDGELDGEMGMSATAQQ